MTTSIQKNKSSKLHIPCNSSLLKLPREIRLNILEWTDIGRIGDPTKQSSVDRLPPFQVFLRPEPFEEVPNSPKVRSTTAYTLKNEESIENSSISPSIASVLLVNKQIYMETAEILYSKRIFVTDVDTTFPIWLPSLTPYSQSKLRHLSFIINARDMDCFGSDEHLGKELVLSIWKKQIAIMTTSLAIRQLTIRIFVDSTNESPKLERWDTQGIRRFLRMIEALRPLRDLLGFHITLASGLLPLIEDLPHALRYLLGYDGQFDEELDSEDEEAPAEIDLVATSGSHPNPDVQRQVTTIKQLEISPGQGAELFRSWLKKYQPRSVKPAASKSATVRH